MPKNEKGKNIMACSCGYTDKKIEKVVLTESVDREGEKELEIVEEDQDKVLPITEAECPKCMHKKSYYWLIQTRAGDEAETKFHKCVKCKHIWRDYN